MSNKDKLTDEIFSVMEPIEEHISKSDRIRLWLSIDRDYRIAGKRNRIIKVFLQFLAASVGMAAAVVVGVFIYSEFVLNNSQEGGFGLQLVADYSPEKCGEISLVLPGDTVNVAENAKVTYTESTLSITSDGETHLRDIAAEDEIHKLFVPYGKIARLKLSDGTEIHLNAGSIVAFNAKMAGKSRILYLNGEAYLDVAHDESRPFEVITDKMSVSVLGTSFDVKAYQDEEYQSVVLVSGRVKVGSERLDDDYVMSPNQRFTIDRSGGAEVKTVEAEDYVCWTTNFLKFRRSDIADVLSSLARHYNADFVCDETVKGLSITGNMDISGSLENALENLSIVSGISYRKEKNGIYVITMLRR